MMAALRMMAVVMTMMMVLIDDDGGDGDGDYDGDDAVMVLFDAVLLLRNGSLLRIHTKERIHTHVGSKPVMLSHGCPCCETAVSLHSYVRNQCCDNKIWLDACKPENQIMTFRCRLAIYVDCLPPFPFHNPQCQYLSLIHI